MGDSGDFVKQLMREGNFETIGELMFPLQAKQIIASAIFAACDIARTAASEKLISLPRRSYWNEAHKLQFTIDEILTNYCDKPALEGLRYEAGEKLIAGCGYPYSEYSSDYGDFHVKKEKNKGRLPSAKSQRIHKAQSNQTSLDFSGNGTYVSIDERSLKPYSIVVFNHRKFNLEYVGFGFPECDYSDWASPFVDISSYVTLAMVEEIQKTHGETLHENFIRKEEILDRALISLK